MSPAFFLQNVFLVLKTAPSFRLPALNYLARRLPDALDRASADVGVGLVIRGVAEVLQDENVLVRRLGMDLLLRILPLEGILWQ